MLILENTARRIAGLTDYFSVRSYTKLVYVIIKAYTCLGIEWHRATGFPGNYYF